MKTVSAYLCSDGGMGGELWGCGCVRRPVPETRPESVPQREVVRHAGLSHRLRDEARVVELADALE